MRNMQKTKHRTKISAGMLSWYRLALTDSDWIFKYLYKMNCYTDTDQSGREDQIRDSCSLAFQPVTLSSIYSLGVEHYMETDFASGIN